MTSPWNCGRKRSQWKWKVSAPSTHSNKYRQINSWLHNSPPRPFFIILGYVKARLQCLSIFTIIVERIILALFSVLFTQIKSWGINISTSWIKWMEIDRSLQSACAWLCASYTGVKTSAIQHHTVKTKDEHHGQRMLTRRYPISWPERQPLAIGNRATPCPVSCKQEREKNQSLLI